MDLSSFEEIKFHVIAVCHSCNLFHKIECGYSRIMAELTDWEHKHPAGRGCQTEYACTERKTPKNLDDRQWMQQGIGPAWMEYGENTNFNLAFRASAPITNALTSLASSATLIAGYESAIVDNSSNKDLDIFISMITKVGSSGVAVGIIEVSSISMLSDSVWPDTITGSTAQHSMTSTGVKSAICVPMGYMNVDATTANRVYAMTKRSLASLYGGVCPDKSVIYTVHNTSAALSSTAGDHVTTQQSVYIVGV